jgi:hypothetical protein
MSNTSGEALQPAPAELLGLPGFAVPPGGTRPDGSLEGMLQDAPPMGFQNSSFLHQLPNQQLQGGFPGQQQQQLQQLQQQPVQQQAAAAAPAGAKAQSSGAGAAAAPAAPGVNNNDALAWYQRNGVTPIALTQEQIDFRRMQQQHHFIYQQQQQQQRYQLELQRQYALSSAVTGPGAPLPPPQQQQQQPSELQPQQMQHWLPQPSATGATFFGGNGGMQMQQPDHPSNKRSADGSDVGGAQASSSSIVSDMGSFGGFDAALGDQQQQFGERKRQRTGPLVGALPTTSAAVGTVPSMAAAAVPSLMSEPVPGLGFNSSALQPPVNAAANANAAAAAAMGVGPPIILAPSLPPVKPPVKCASIANDNPTDGRRARSRSWDIDTNLWTLVERGTRVSTMYTATTTISNALQCLCSAVHRW